MSDFKGDFMKKILVLLSLLFALNTVSAEQGEFQFMFGAGGYFPLKQYTQNKNVYIYASYNIPVAFYFGLTDNFDIGITGSFTRLTDTNINTEYNGLSGREYFDYYHININGRLRYNWLPGYVFFAPHIFVGLGNNIENFSNRQFFVDGDRLYNDFNKGSYTDGTLNFQVGIDFTSRVWWFFLLNLELVYNHTLDNTNFFELNFYIGFDWFLKSYGGR